MEKIITYVLQAIMLIILLFLTLSANSVSANSVEPGNMKVEWRTGAEDCSKVQSIPLQVHAYNSNTYILRQNPCLSFEASFLYLLIGTDKAILIDSGAIADPESMPLAKTITKRLTKPDMKLIIAHTHSHSDHKAGDSQFRTTSNNSIVPTELSSIQSFYNLPQWPNDISQLNLGDRIIHVIPTPGHHPNHLTFYDENTGLVFSGDFLLPGRLMVNNLDAYQQSADRLIKFLKDRPVTHILGGHIELNSNGELYTYGAQFHPNERSLELTKDDLLNLPEALENFNGFYNAHDNYVITNPVRLLIVSALTILIILAVIIWLIRKWIKRRRQKSL